MSKPKPGTEEFAHELSFAKWGTDSTSHREKLAFRDGHHAGWLAAIKGLEEISSALRLAIQEKRAFVIGIEGRNGAMLTLHNCDDSIIAARMLERHARAQRGE